MKAEIFPLMKAGHTEEYLPLHVKKEHDAEDNHVEDNHAKDDHTEAGHAGDYDVKEGRGNKNDDHEEDHWQDDGCVGNDHDADDLEDPGQEEGTDDEEVVFQDVQDIDNEIAQFGMGYIL